MDCEGEALDPAPGLLRIHAVAKATGVSPHTLRIWERRYGTMASHRSAAGYRLYTSDDVERIQFIKELLDAGYSIGEVAGLSRDELLAMQRRTRPRAEMPSVPARDVSLSMLEVGLVMVRESFLSAVERFDLSEAERALATAGLAIEPVAVVSELVGPLLTEIGQRWQDGRFSIAHEHVASAAVRAYLSELIRTAKPAADAPIFVCTTPAGELHELGALMAAVVLAHASARVVYLGPSTPVADIVFACKRSGAHGAVLSVIAQDQVDALRELTHLRSALPSSVRMYVGGRATPEPVPVGVTHISQLAGLVGIARA